MITQTVTLMPYPNIVMVIFLPFGCFEATPPFTRFLGDDRLEDLVSYTGAQIEW